MPSILTNAAKEGARKKSADTARSPHKTTHNKTTIDRKQHEPVAKEAMNKPRFTKTQPSSSVARK